MPPKCSYLLSKLHSVTFQKPVIFMFTTVRISNFVPYISLNWFLVVKLMEVHSHNCWAASMSTEDIVWIHTAINMPLIFDNIIIIIKAVFISMFVSMYHINV